jgi:F-type H+-transporting ATPase subunit gamma
MSQLIQMRRRIQTIETIHKITNAMRLIAMSGHTRLKHKEELVKQYNSQIEELYGQIRAQIPTNFDPLANRIDPNGPELIILVGSQKGLCGNFNTNVFNTFEGYIQQEAQPHIIAIGRRAEDFVKDKHYSHVIQSFSKFSTTNINEIVSSISEIINNTTQSYSRISIVSNVLKTFFAQRPVINQLLPLINEPEAIGHTDEKQKTVLFEDYMWKQPPQSIIKDLAYLYLTAKLHTILFQSLLAEQAARFLSMDNSTRNAEGLLELSKIQYNKLRQAKITKEINELVSSMSNN